MQSRVGWALVVLIAAVLFGLAGWFVWSAPKLGAGERLGASQSGGQSPDVVQSFEGLVVQSGAETVMSGGYEVGADGKLLRPKDAPVPSVPVPPDVMRYETPEGMEAFARYVMDLVPYIWMTGDTRKLEEISLPECSWCEDTINKAKRQFANGHWIDNVEHRIEQMGRPIEIEGHPHLWHVHLFYTRTSATIFDGDGIQSLPEKRTEISIQALYEDGRWKISEAGQLE